MYTPKAVLATVLAIIAGAPALSLAQNSLMDQARALFEPIPEAPTSMEGVPMTPQLVALGKAGLKLFIDRGCAACHTGVNVGGGMYAPFGVVEKPGADFLPPVDKGRFQVTSTTSDEYVFKVPTLRNIELTPPYFHSGKSWDLKQAIAVMATSQLGQELSDEEVGSIEAFLLALTGEQPQITYPILPPGTVDTPRPHLLRDSGLSGPIAEFADNHSA